MSGNSPVGTIPPTGLRGRTPAWGAAVRVALAACVAAGLWLRLRGLAAEGFADDEIHKWLAAARYLHGDFGGDDVEHPMLMKWLIALAAAVLPRSYAPEAITRLPNALAGGVSIWVTAQLGRRLFGRAAGLIAAGLAATSAAFVGYQRIAKEDTLLGLFLLLMLWCFAEAKAASTDERGRDQRRWEVAGALCFGAMLASKYYLTYFLIPVLAWAWVAKQGGTWPMPRRRWLMLVGVSFAIFAAFNWTPFMPSTWQYFLLHLRGGAIGDRASSETLWFMGRLWRNMAFQYRDTVPPWFYPVFFVVKLAPPTMLCAVAGLALALRRRDPAERIVLVWLGVWYANFLFTGAKYARMAVSALPAVFLLAAYAAVEVAPAVHRAVAGLRGRGADAAGRLGPAAAVGALAILLVGSEARAAVSHAPHYRLYVNAIGGGDRSLDYFFPHCDYFDAGLRETVAWIAARAEPDAEVCSEAEWPVRYYADEAGRKDLTTSTITRARGCGSGRPCYVIVQTGRLYSHNQAALERLSHTEPAHVERVRGSEAVKVYRLGPGEPLFPEARAAEAAR